MSPKKGKAGIVGSVIYYIVLTLIVIAVGLMFVNKLHNRPTFLFNKTCIWIITESMEDTIPKNTYILVEKLTAEEIKPGDIITFVSDDPRILGQLNTHRVESIVDNGNGIEFVTKGDNNPGEDKYTAKGDKLIGRYIENIPWLSSLAEFVYSPFGIFIILACAAVSVYASDIVHIINKKKSSAQKDTKAALSGSQDTPENNTKPTDEDIGTGPGNNTESGNEDIWTDIESK